MPNTFMLNKQFNFLKRMVEVPRTIEYRIAQRVVNMARREVVRHMLPFFIDDGLNTNVILHALRQLVRPLNRRRNCCNLQPKNLLKILCTLRSQFERGNM